MTTALPIDNKTARRLLLNRAGLAGQPASGRDLPALLETLAYVQLDSIRMVERAHHHILHTRLQSYRPRDLDRLYCSNTDRGGCAFEHWTHDTSLISLNAYPHWRHRFEDSRKRMAAHDGWRKRLGDGDALKAMREHLETKGPTKARDHETRQGERGPWWDWAPHKSALEYLWNTGEVAVAGRDGFEKVYDLTERVIPKTHLEERPSRRDTIDWACRAALSRLGAGTAAEIQDFFCLASRQDVDAWLKASLAQGEVIPVEIEAAGAKPWTAYALPTLEDALPGLAQAEGRLRALSPFDPLVRDRKRLQRLFGSDYRIEIFVPADKRQYGYYVFPLLEGDRFVGRAEIKANRERGELELVDVWWEPRFGASAARMGRLDAELRRLARLARVAPPASAGP